MKRITVLGLVACFVLLFFALHHQLIIIQWPYTSTSTVHLATGTERRCVTLYYWHHDKWMHETVDIIWSTQKDVSIKHLVDSWLTLMDEERLMEKKVSLQSVMLAPSDQEAYLSFDRNPFAAESSTYDKWMWVESLLKTLRDNGIKLQSVRFLVHHQDMYDYHVDFSKAWPLIGFLPQHQH